MNVFHEAQCVKRMCVNLCEIYDWINSVPACIPGAFLLPLFYKESVV
jgi:hypothetical protein